MVEKIYYEVRYSGREKPCLRYGGTENGGETGEMFLAFKKEKKTIKKIG